MSHPMPLHPLPQAAYHYAAIAFLRECAVHGTARAVALFEPRQIAGGWWSPLFDAVLRTPEAPHA